MEILLKLFLTFLKIGLVSIGGGSKCRNCRSETDGGLY